MRLLVKEVIVGKDLITIKHSIPVQATPAVGNPKHLNRLLSKIRHRAKKVIFCVRGVISPLLANLYLHYSLDCGLHEVCANLRR